MSRQKLLRNAEVSIGEWRRWRMTAELETGVSHVLELAMHLKRSAELAARDAAAVAQDAALQRVVVDVTKQQSPRMLPCNTSTTMHQN